MMKTLKTILLPTNICESCMHAFNLGAVLAERFRATLVILHVIDAPAADIEARLQRLLGKEAWGHLLDGRQADARNSLIGKKTANRLIRDAMDHFCTLSGIAENAAGRHAREIVVTNGNVVEDILYYSKTFNCELILLGARRGDMVETELGPTVSAVLRKSQIPVLLAPSPPGQTGIC